jgi:competence protein ComEC
VWWPAVAHPFDEVIGSTLGVSGHASSYLTVRFLDVGQGDAIQVITPDGYEMLIDGGPSASVLRELASGRSFFDRSIDVVIATHPDTDHVAGLVDVLKRYDVGMIIETAVHHDAPAAVAFLDTSGSEAARRISAQAGQTIMLGASTTVRILSPQGDTTDWETNTASVVVQVVYGDIEFMLTGDAPSSIEEYLTGAVGANLKSEVLKLGHHGSDTSSSEVFLEAVGPQYAVVSAGKDNRYGHPHAEVLRRVSEAGSRIVSTAEQGTITFNSDGRRVWIK